MNSADNSADHPRLLVLIERFHQIDATMRDLPIYNPKVSIEAVGFRPFSGDALLGVMITPWFMNLTLLPVVPVPMDMAAIGKTVLVELPVGQRTFAINGDAVTGLYKAHSLYSPMAAFTLPGQAAAEARRMLALLMAPETVEPEAANRSGASSLDRRALLFRRRRHA